MLHVTYGHIFLDKASHVPMTNFRGCGEVQSRLYAPELKAKLKGQENE